MWLFQCTLDKFLILVSFLVVVVIFSVLVTEDDNYDDLSWLLDQVTPQDAASAQLDPEGEAGAAARLAAEVRVMCLVMTHPANHRTKATKVRGGSISTSLKSLRLRKLLDLSYFVFDCLSLTFFLCFSLILSFLTFLGFT